MIQGLLGKKLGMTQIFNQEGNIVPVTVIEAGPCPILQIKTVEKDGYSAIQVGFEARKESRVNKPLTGHFKKAGVKPKHYIREFSVEKPEDYKIGQDILLDIFAVSDAVDIIGVSIGKGFQGGMKRHNWSGGPESHGSMHHRAPGSVGASSDPSRTYKGQKLPGRMGNARVTVQNLEVMSIDKDNNLLVVKGAVPGSDGGLLVIRKGKKKTRILAKQKPVVKKKKEEAKMKKAQPAKKK